MTNIFSHRFAGIFFLILFPFFVEAQPAAVSDSIGKTVQTGGLSPDVKGYPVYSPMKDTLFLVYNKVGSFPAEERSRRITNKIEQLYNDDFLQTDSILALPADGYADIIYKDLIVMTVLDLDARCVNDTLTYTDLAEKYVEVIKSAIVKAKAQNDLARLLERIGLTLLVVTGACAVIWFIILCYKRLKKFITGRNRQKLHGFSYKGYTFLTVKQQLTVILFLVNVLKWFSVALAVYLILPLAFAILPFTHGGVDYFFALVWSPFHKIFLSLWNYLPNLISILVIFFVFKYLLRFVKYLFSEIASERLKITGFYPDWAMTTFQIVRIFLIAFALIVMFPYLPGNNSPAFQGISIFIGVLVSLGSSSAIANVIAGLVITYMRPFKVGDRIKLGDVTGDVIEKTILVTRLRTIKNEEITIPNLTILQGNTINYSAFSKEEGLIVHTTVTMGYEVAWQDVHQALIDAALMTGHILPDPKPFVLQSSLDDFYVTYQINAYTREASNQSKIYSDLHQNIQDVCNERGLEGVSPHYRVQRTEETTSAKK
ncbi:MAG: mechanosensitive ion channel family protein [Prevotellaceae bacterium]|jgi:small-conductance mechanosensitive channel|nr:mechanosensitive ion channel family protein [Prevotellaceae bacterium]